MNLDDLTAEESDKLYQMYVADCERSGATPNFSDFFVWVEEQH